MEPTVHPDTLCDGRDDEGVREGVREGGRVRRGAQGREKGLT